jgi:hypothetical protein
MDYILSTFQVTDDEYRELDKEFGDLAHYAAWQLIQKNVKNNHTDDQEDIAQEIRWASIKAASYFKRQVYLEKCMKIARKHVKDSGAISKLDELEWLWKNRTKHGASKQKFGPRQEKVLDEIVNKYVPVKDRPSKQAPLEFSKKFAIVTNSMEKHRT